MIGRHRPPARRAPALLAMAALLPGIVFAARPGEPALADPPAAASRGATLVAHAGDAARALGDLAGPLRDAVASRRRGAALVVAGDEQPAPELEAASARVAGAVALADRAAAAVRRLRGVAEAAGIQPRPEALAASAPGALSGIAAQLRDSAAAAETFAARRRDAEATVRAFADALDAIERRRPREALRAADRAEARLEAVAAWERASRLVTLRFWLDTMGALLDASRRAAQATLDGDSAEAAAAVRDWRAAAEEAHRADVALGVAIAEGGSSVTAPPLQRLARALAELDEAQTLVASLVHPSTARSPSGRAP